jgi:hypothetical protein
VLLASLLHFALVFVDSFTTINTIFLPPLICFALYFSLLVVSMAFTLYKILFWVLVFSILAFIFITYDCYLLCRCFLSTTKSLVSPFLFPNFILVRIYILFALELPMDTKIDYVLLTICIALLIDVLQEMVFFAANAISLSLFKPIVIPLVEHQSKLIFTLATLHEF